MDDRACKNRDYNISFGGAKHFFFWLLLEGKMPFFWG